MYVCTHHCAQLSYTTRHRTVPIIFASYPPDNHHSSDDVYWDNINVILYAAT